MCKFFQVFYKQSWTNFDKVSKNQSLINSTQLKIVAKITDLNFNCTYKIKT